MAIRVTWTFQQPIAIVKEAFSIMVLVFLTQCLLINQFVQNLINTRTILSAEEKFASDNIKMMEVTYLNIFEGHNKHSMKLLYHTWTHGVISLFPLFIFMF